VIDDFAASAIRHFRDGDLLQGSRRSDNADQLYGLATECAIKTALSELPTCLADGGLSPAYRKHVNEIWSLVPLQNLGRRHRGLVVVLKALRDAFTTWSIDQRYGPDGAVGDDVVEGHRRVASRVLGSVGLVGSRRGA
jgi:hypothetical protein